MPPYAMGADGIVVDLGETDVPSTDDATVDVAPEVEHTVRSGKALYLNDSDAHTVQTAAAAAQWTRSPLVTDDDLRRPLWTFAFDVPGQPGAADGSGGIWHLYDGPVTA